MESPTRALQQHTYLCVCVCDYSAPCIRPYNTTVDWNCHEARSCIARHHRLCSIAGVLSHLVELLS